MDPSLIGDTFYLDDFAARQWDDPAYAGTKLGGDKATFVRKVHEAYHSGTPLVDGYAPFCKHIFIPNFTGAKVASVVIDDSNRHLVQTGYTARRAEELPVLSRWIAAHAVDPPEAAMLDVILYSHDQIVKEKSAIEGSAAGIPDVAWGIISVKAQDEDFETPMQPITMMRNALGRDEGGSGVALDREKYSAAVAYWRHRVPLT